PPRASPQRPAANHAPGGRQVVPEPPGEPHAVVVMRAPRPPRPRAADDGLPQAGHALRETVEGGAETDRLDEGQGGSRAADPQRGMVAEAAGPSRFEVGGARDARSGGGCGSGPRDGSVTASPAPTAPPTPAAPPRP